MGNSCLGRDLLSLGKLKLGGDVVLDNLDWFFNFIISVENLFDQVFLHFLLIKSDLNPRMSFDLFKCWSHPSVSAEHFDYQVFEAVRQFVLLGFLEICLQVTSENHVVIFIGGFGFMKWEDSSDDDEQNDTYGKDVSLVPVVDSGLLNFRGHVSHGTPVGSEVADLLGCKSEVCNLQIGELVKENILQLEVSVAV